ncbi:DUF4352 domain-containing protein [Nesterenkonia haasae]|uniref:DUF4352 domain-containing protein n=1 Tax=Nesterenkonia haasae TaxID=2587813 RepID=UPI001391A916|nr:DUF4352 domain-containing protein [Nesterenkonia haasae]NDK31425.1 DUF4352 domain-containing protein [Nesterenkonia haasae]
MKRLWALYSSGILLLTMLTACDGDAAAEGSPDETQANEVPDSGPTDSDEGVPEKEEDYVDQLDLGMSDTGYISTTTGESAITVEAVEFTGFWEMIDEHGYSPHSSFDPEAVAIVDVTLENIGDTTFDADDAVSNLEFNDGEWIREHHSGQGPFISAGDADFEVEGLIEGDLQPGGAVSGKLYYPVFDSAPSNWGVTMQGGIVACCATNDLSWTFDADPGIDTAADEEFRH